MMRVTEDTPPDLLSGRMALQAILPDGNVIQIQAERSTPMMDLLIQVCTKARLQPSGHVVQALGPSRGDKRTSQTDLQDVDSRAVLACHPNTPIGTLDTQCIRVLSKTMLRTNTLGKDTLYDKNKAYGGKIANFAQRVGNFNLLGGRSNKNQENKEEKSPKMSKVPSVPLRKKILPSFGKNNKAQPFETTFRLTVNLPRNQLYVVRISPGVMLDEILDMVCREKNLDSRKYEFRHPDNISQVLPLNTQFGALGINELTLVSTTNPVHTSHSPQSPSKDNLTIVETRGLSRSHNSLNSLQNAKHPTFQSQLSLSSHSSLETRKMDTPSGDESHRLSMQSLESLKPKAPARKRKPAPKPPSLQNINQSVESLTTKINNTVEETRSTKSYTSDEIITNYSKTVNSPQRQDSKNSLLSPSHSRSSSDSSGYHEPSVLSEGPAEPPPKSKPIVTVPPRKKKAPAPPRPVIPIKEIEENVTKQSSIISESSESDPLERIKTLSISDVKVPERPVVVENHVAPESPARSVTPPKVETVDTPLPIAPIPKPRPRLVIPTPNEVVLIPPPVAPRKLKSTGSSSDLHIITNSPRIPDENNEINMVKPVKVYPGMYSNTLQKALQNELKLKLKHVEMEHDSKSEDEITTPDGNSRSIRLENEKLETKDKEPIKPKDNESQLSEIQLIKELETKQEISENISTDVFLDTSVKRILKSDINYDDIESETDDESEVVSDIFEKSPLQNYFEVDLANNKEDFNNESTSPSIKSPSEDSVNSFKSSSSPTSVKIFKNSNNFMLGKSMVDFELSKSKNSNLNSGVEDVVKDTDSDFEIDDINIFDGYKPISTGKERKSMTLNSKSSNKHDVDFENFKLKKPIQYNIDYRSIKTEASLEELDISHLELHNKILLPYPEKPIEWEDKDIIETTQPRDSITSSDPPSLPPPSPPKVSVTANQPVAIASTKTLNKEIPVAKPVQMNEPIDLTKIDQIEPALSHSPPPPDWTYTLPAPPTPFADRVTTFTDKTEITTDQDIAFSDRESDIYPSNLTIISDATAVSDNIILPVIKESVVNVNKLYNPSEISSVSEQDDSTLVSADSSRYTDQTDEEFEFDSGQVSLESLQKRQHRCAEAELSNIDPSPPRVRSNEIDEVDFSRNEDSVAQRLSENSRSSLMGELQELLAQSEKSGDTVKIVSRSNSSVQKQETTNLLPNFKISTYEKKPNVSIFEDDTVRSNADAKRNSLNKDEAYLNKADDVVLRKNSNNKININYLNKRNSITRSGSFHETSPQIISYRNSLDNLLDRDNDENEFTFNKPAAATVKRSTSHASINHIKDDSNTSTGGWGLQSLQVMRTILPKLTNSQPSSPTEEYKKTDILVTSKSAIQSDCSTNVQEKSNSTDSNLVEDSVVDDQKSLSNDNIQNTSGQYGRAMINQLSSVSLNINNTSLSNDVKHNNYTQDSTNLKQENVEKAENVVVENNKEAVTIRESVSQPEPIVKRWTYTGPPGIILGTWNERPKSQVSVKNDRDYKMGGVLSKASIFNQQVTQNQNKNSDNIKLNQNIKRTSQELTNGDSKNDVTMRLISHSTPTGFKKLNSVDCRRSMFEIPNTEINDAPYSLPTEVSHVPVVRSVELKKDVKLDGIDTCNSNETLTLGRAALKSRTFFKSSDNVNILNTSPRTSSFGKHDAIFKVPVVKGFKHVNNSIEDVNTQPKMNGDVIAKTNRMDLPKKVVSPLPVENNVVTPFSQHTLKRTGLKERMLEAPQQSEVVNNKTSIRINTLPRESRTVSLPPPPPKMPVVRSVMRKTNTQKSFVSVEDPRSQLLDDIRNFGKANLRKID